MGQQEQYICDPDLKEGLFRVTEEKVGKEKMVKVIFSRI
jgi:hypothetical protein